VPGIDLPGVHTCWTLEDARHILKLAKPHSKVLLLGAGFIGCIILEALAERHVDLTVVEMGDRMVPRMMNQTAGNLIKSWCESKNIKVHTSTRVNAIEENKTPVPSGLQRLLNAIGMGSRPEPPAHSLRVSLSNDHVVDADLVISAAGVKPNIEFLKDSGVEIKQGILVDHHLQTNIEGIYAAGDVAEGRDFSTGGYQVHAIQPTASDHGRIAALNMAGVPTDYQGSLIMNVLDTVGLISSSFGLWMGVDGGEAAEVCDPERYRYINLEFKDDVMVGATSLGLTQHVGVLRGLIQGKVPLGGWKDKLLDDPTRIMEAYLAKNHLVQPVLR
jgi:NADPH-dependent 2,4-dienoyl-CoA reductase/sulfur reductase-like enzyme